MPSFCNGATCDRGANSRAAGAAVRPRVCVGALAQRVEPDRSVAASSPRRRPPPRHAPDACFPPPAKCRANTRCVRPKPLQSQNVLQGPVQVGTTVSAALRMDAELSSRQPARLSTPAGATMPSGLTVPNPPCIAYLRWSASLSLRSEKRLVPSETDRSASASSRRP